MKPRYWQERAYNCYTTEDTNASRPPASITCLWALCLVVVGQRANRKMFGAISDIWFARASQGSAQYLVLTNDRGVLEDLLTPVCIMNVMPSAERVHVEFVKVNAAQADD